VNDVTGTLDWNWFTMNAPGTEALRFVLEWERRKRLVALIQSLCSLIPGTRFESLTFFF
jgi:hypothetical protein